MEGDEVRIAAALHGLPRGHRRVDATGEEAQNAAERADRQTARPGQTAQEDVRALVADLDAELELGVLQLHLDALRPGQDALGDEAVEVGRLDREALVRAPRANPEGDGAPLRIVEQRVLEDRSTDLGDGLGQGLDGPGRGHGLDAEDVLQATRRVGRTRLGTHGDAAGGALALHRSDVLQRVAHVAHERALEFAAVALLEGQLSVANEDDLGGGDSHAHELSASSSGASSQMISAARSTSSQTVERVKEKRKTRFASCSVRCNASSAGLIVPLFAWHAAPTLT